MKKTLVVISELNPSNLTISIVEELRNRTSKIKIIYIHKNYELSPDRQLIVLRPNHQFAVRTSSLFSWISVLFQVVVICLRNRPNSLYSSGRLASLIGMTAGWLARIPKRIYTRHHGVELHDAPKTFQVKLDMLTSGFATNVVSISSGTTKVLCELEKVSRSKIVYIPNGIDLTSKKQYWSPAKSKLNDDRIEIGIISRQTYWKGIEYAAQAFVDLAKKYPNIFLTLYGSSGDATTKIDEMFQQLDTSRYVVVKSHRESQEIFAELDIFIHVPISPLHEAFGLVYLEAIAHGTTSVFTRSGVLLDIQTDMLPNNVFMVDFNNTTQIRERIIQIIGDRGKATLNTNSELLSRFDLQSMAQSYSSLILD